MGVDAATRSQRDEMAAAARDAQGKSVREQGEAAGAAMQKHLDTKVENDLHNSLLDYTACYCSLACFASANSAAAMLLVSSTSASLLVRWACVR